VDFATFLQFLLSGITTGCVYALIALCFVLCAQVSGIINFAQGEYAMLGGIVAAMLFEVGVPLLPAVLLAATTGALVGALQERATLAPVAESSIFIQVTMTLAVAILLRTGALVIAGKDPLTLPSFSGDGAFSVLGAILPLQTAWIWAATIASLAGVFYFLRRTHTGRGVRACASNVEAARLMGVNVPAMQLLVFAGAGALGAVVGAIIAPLTQAHWLLGIDFSLKGFIGALIGNMRSPGLAVAGGLGIGAIEALAVGYGSSAFKEIVVYGVLLAYLMVQGGAFGSRRLSPASKRH
jgi:branched-subunit amino acid ABC-type transport system permease component